MDSPPSLLLGSFVFFFPSRPDIWEWRRSSFSLSANTSPNPSEYWSLHLLTQEFLQHILSPGTPQPIDRFGYQFPVEILTNQWSTLRPPLFYFFLQFLYSAFQILHPMFFSFRSWTIPFLCQNQPHFLRFSKLSHPLCKFSKSPSRWNSFSTSFKFSKSPLFPEHTEMVSANRSNEFRTVSSISEIIALNSSNYLVNLRFWFSKPT